MSELEKESVKNEDSQDIVVGTIPDRNPVYIDRRIRIARRVTRWFS